MNTNEARIEALGTELDALLPEATEGSVAAARVSEIAEELRSLGIDVQVWG